MLVSTLLYLRLSPITYLAWNSSTVSLPPQTPGLRHRSPPHPPGLEERQWSFQPTSACGTVRSSSLGLPSSSLLPWVLSRPPPLHLTSDNPDPLTLPSLSPQSTEVVRHYPPWAKVLLAVLIVLTLLPIPVHFLHTLLHEHSPVSKMRSGSMVIFKATAEETVSEHSLRLPVGQSATKRNKMRSQRKPLSPCE